MDKNSSKSKRNATGHKCRKSGRFGPKIGSKAK